VRHKGKLNSFFLVSFIGLINILGFHNGLAETGTQRLDLFYSQEFTKFNETLTKHIAQLDACIKEMSSFEEGAVFLDPVECGKYNVMKSKLTDLLTDFKIVVQSYNDWVATLSDDNSNSDKLSWPPFDQAQSLIRIFLVKFEQALAQSKRVQELEGSLVKEFKELFQGLGILEKEKGKY